MDIKLNNERMAATFRQLTSVIQPRVNSARRDDKEPLEALVALAYAVASVINVYNRDRKEVVDFFCGQLFDAIEDLGRFKENLR